MSSEPTSGWTPERPGRGTWGIVTSCLATLFLCVHTALHLNVVPKGVRKRWIFINKLKWVLMGMFAPELVLFTAWSQWMSAKKLTEKVNKCTGKQDNSKKFEWKMIHSHYAQMGGFVIDTNDPGEDQYIPDSPRLFLTANGVAALAEMGHLPTISEEAILDKSKTSSLGKTIASLQALWLMVHCFERVVYGLPLAPLERNTLAHAACALIMYFLWWDKPVNIHIPMVLSGPWCRPVIATMWMFSRISGANKDYHTWGSPTLPPEIEGLLYIEKASNMKDALHGVVANEIVIEMDSMYSPETDMHVNKSDGHLTINLNRMSNEQSPEPIPEIRIEHSQGDFLFPFGLGPKASSQFFQTEKCSWTIPPKCSALEVTDIVDDITFTRWRLAHQCLKNYPGIWDRYKKESRTFDRDGEPWVLSEYSDKLCRDSLVDLGISNWPGTGLIRPEKSYLSVLFLSICVMLYGGIHAGGWAVSLPSPQESTLWKFSSLYIASSGLLYAYTEALGPIATWITTTVGISDSNQGFLHCWFGRLRYLFGVILKSLIWIAFLGAFCPYIAARSFIIVETFISLRRLPTKVYDTPEINWSRYLFHL